MEKIMEFFEFKQCVSLLKSTGKKAKNLRELRDAIAVVSDESIFHHTYQYFLKGHILEYTNDLPIGQERASKKGRLRSVFPT